LLRECLLRERQQKESHEEDAHGHGGNLYTKLAARMVGVYDSARKGALTS
jgi:hypothetical protein